jgi:putative ABC transport system permease protein
MRPRWRKALTDISVNRIRSLLVIASIVIGLFALGTISTIYFVVRDDMRTGYASVNPANIQMTTSLFDQKMLSSVSKIRGVRQAEGARNLTLRLQTAPGEWTTFNIRSVHDWDKLNINRLHLESGNWPPGDHELAIERYKLHDLNTNLGEEVTLQINGDQNRSIKFTAIVSEQTLGAFETGPGFFLAPAQGYVNENTLEWLGEPKAYLFNTLYVTVDQNSEDEAYLRSFADRLAHDLEKGGVSTYGIAVRGSFDHPNRIFADAIAALLIILGFLVVFLSGFLITNTLQALVSQQGLQIGIMKTVGARQHQIIIVYMMLILFFSLISIMIAVPLSYQTSFSASALLANQINFEFQGRRLIPAAILLQVFMGLAIPQVAAFIPIWQGAQLTIQETLSGVRQDHLLYQDWLSRRIARIRGLSRPILVALRNTIRKKGRLILTVMTLSLGGAVFIATFNVRNSMSEYVHQISQYFLGDINLTFRYPYRIEEIDRILSGMPQIDFYETWSGARTEMYLKGNDIGESVQLLAPPSNSKLVRPVMLEGRWIQPGDQNAIVLNERFRSSYPDIKIGDTLRLRVNGKETRWIVVGFFRLAGKRTSPIAYTSFEFLSRLLGQLDQASIFRIVANQKNMTELEQKALGREIENILETMGFEIYEVTAGSWLSSTAAQGFSVLTAFLLFLAILTALVGSIGLAGTMSMNVLERTREIGIMRAIGASNPILMRIILLEGLTIGLISWGIAMLLAMPISKVLYDSVSYAIFGVQSPLAPTLTGFAIWLVLVIMLSILSSFLPAKNATGLTIREVLAYE